MEKYYVYDESNLDETKPCQVEQIPFACTIARIELILEDGYVIDPKLSFSFNDVDLCRRVWDKGYKIYQVPTALIIHDHGASQRKQTNTAWNYKIAHKSQIHYFRKHHKNKVWILKIMLIIEILISIFKRKLIKHFNLKIKYFLPNYMKIHDIIMW